MRPGYPFYELRLVDEHDIEVAPGEIGELIMRTAVPWTMNAGYLNMPEATNNAWRNGWFHTGDAFKQDELGRFFFKDRMKDTIRRRGENVSSYEVEAEVILHPGVLECAAIAVPADEAEDEIKVVVVRQAGSALSGSELVEYLDARLPRFMVPRYVQFVDELPKTPTLRIQKALISRSVAAVRRRVRPEHHPNRKDDLLVTSTEQASADQTMSERHPYAQLLDRIVVAAEAGDPSGLDGVYTEDAVIWHSHDNKTQTLAQNMKLLVMMDKWVGDREYADRRVYVYENGVAQTHTLRGTKRSTGERLELHAMVVCEITDGKISRLNEFLDPGEAARFGP